MALRTSFHSPASFSCGCNNASRKAAAPQAPRNSGMPGQAEALLRSICGPDFLGAMNHNFSALVNVADIALTDSAMKGFLRSLVDLYSRLQEAESQVHQWRVRFDKSQAMLEEARREVMSVRAYAAKEHHRAEEMQIQTSKALRSLGLRDGDLRSAAEKHKDNMQRLESEMATLASQGMAQSRAFASEQAEAAAAKSELAILRVELEVTNSKSRQQAVELEAARKRVAGSDLTAEYQSQERVRMEALLRHRTQEHHTEVSTATEAANAEANRLREKVDSLRRELQGVRSHYSDVDRMWTEAQALSPCVTQAAEFTIDPESPAARVLRLPVQTIGGAPCVRLPVSALRWRPGASMDTTPGWPTLRGQNTCRPRSTLPPVGLYCLLHQLQTGAVSAEEIELTVCCAEGRWFMTQQDDDHRFAALLMFQSLRRDAPVAVTCRVGSPDVLLGMTIADLAIHTGLSLRDARAQWRTPPENDEAFLECFLRNSPFAAEIHELVTDRQRRRARSALEHHVENAADEIAAGELPNSRSSSRHPGLNEFGEQGLGTEACNVFGPTRQCCSGIHQGALADNASATGATAAGGVALVAGHAPGNQHHAYFRPRVPI